VKVEIHPVTSIKSHFRVSRLPTEQTYYCSEQETVEKLGVVPIVVADWKNPLNPHAPYIHPTTKTVIQRKHWAPQSSKPKKTVIFVPYDDPEEKKVNDYVVLTHKNAILHDMDLSADYYVRIQWKQNKQATANSVIGKVRNFTKTNRKDIPPMIKLKTFVVEGYWLNKTQEKTVEIPIPFIVNIERVYLVGDASDVPPDSNIFYYH
jgi:hypothetical protein